MMKPHILTACMAIALALSCNRVAQETDEYAGKLGYVCKNLPKDDATSSEGKCDASNGSCHKGYCVVDFNAQCQSDYACKRDLSASCSNANGTSTGTCCIKTETTATSVSHCCSGKFKSGSSSICRAVSTNTSSSNADEGEEGGECKDDDECDDDLVCIKKSDVDEEYEEEFNESRQCFACGDDGQPCCKDDECGSGLECREPRSSESDGDFGDDFKYCLDEDEEEEDDD